MQAGQPEAAKSASIVPLPATLRRSRISIDQRIAGLHKSLKITAKRKQRGVVSPRHAGPMKRNAKAVASTQSGTCQKDQSVEDLKIYESFTQAHV